MTPGDFVQCTNLDPPCCAKTMNTIILPPPIIGARYIVSHVANNGMCSDCQATVPVMAAIGHVHPFFAWPQSWFAISPPAPDLAEVDERILEPTT